MCTTARKKRLQPLPASIVSKTVGRVSPRQKQHTIVLRDLAAFEKWLEAQSKTLPTSCTLLELVQRLNRYTASDVETVAVVTYLINSGRVRLRGTFAGAKISFPQRRARRNRH